MNNETLMVRFPNYFRQCNFHCPYCTADVGADNVRYKWPYKENHRKILENLVTLDRKINVRLGPAGEFFVSKDLVEDARWLSNQENVEGVNLITNLGFTIKQYEKFFEGFNLDKVALTVSYHPTEIKDVEEWKRTIRYLKELMPVSIVLVAYPPLVYILPSIYDSLSDLNIPIAINGFIGSFQGREYPYAYTDKQKSILKDLSFSRHEYEFWINAIKPGLCNAGFKSVFIDIKNGDVYSCGMPKKIKLGNVLDKVDFALNESSLNNGVFGLKRHFIF